ncbi:primase-helicase family protein [Nitrobacter sp.]|uniref:primase-helicase family protein n=1 Tax=Nitrobacter sp. TaxID=29420 RepID=UPI003F64D754
MTMSCYAELLKRPCLHAIMEGHQYTLPPHDVQLSTSLSLDTLFAWADHAAEHFPVTCNSFDIRDFTWDLRRLVPDKEQAWNVIIPALESWMPDHDWDAMWDAADRPERESDCLIINDLCSIYHSDDAHWYWTMPGQAGRPAKNDFWENLKLEDADRKVLSALFVDCENELIEELSAVEKPSATERMNKTMEEFDKNNTTNKVQYDEFWCYSPTHQFIFTPTGEMWTAATIDSRLAPMFPFAGAKKPWPASKILTQQRAVDQVTWAPGMPQIIKDKLISDGGWFDRPDSRVYNLYRPPTIKPKVGDASPWLNHVKHLYPNEWQHIVAWLANRVQRPGEKINHAIVLGGPQGIGKDSLLQPVAQAIGPWNCSEISPRSAVGRFNGFVKSVILRISEARDRGEQADQYELYEATKTYIAGPPDVLRCDEKNLKEHMVQNVMGVVMTTNHKDGLYLPADDRRHFVCWSNLTKEDFAAEYWNELWGWFGKGGNEIVARYLARYDLSGFNPKAPPPKTDAFWTMVDIGRPPEDAEMADAIDALGKPDAVTLAMIMPRVAHGFGEWLRDRRNARKIKHRFEACDYVAVRNPDDKRDGLWRGAWGRQTVYVRKMLSPKDQIEAARRLTTRPLSPPSY